MALKPVMTGAAEYGQWIKVLIAGDPGAGKTRTSSTWPKPLYASAEGGLLAVRDRNLPAIRIGATSDLLELYQILKQKPDVRAGMVGKLFDTDPIEVETVIIDTLDEVQRLYVKERNAEKRQESMTQPDWGWLGDQLRQLVRAYRNLDMNVVLTTHIKKSEDGETGKQTISPQIQGAFGDEVAGYVDVAMLLTARPMVQVVNGESQRVLVRVGQTYPDSHTTWLKDRSGKLPMELDIDFDDDYARMHALIFEGADPAEYSAPTGPDELPPPKAAAGAKAAPAKAAAPAKKAAAKKAAAAPAKQTAPPADEAPEAPESAAEPPAAEEPTEPDPTHDHDPAALEDAAEKMGVDKGEPADPPEPDPTHDHDPEALADAAEKMAVDREPDSGSDSEQPTLDGTGGPPPGVDPETGEISEETVSSDETVDGEGDADTPQGDARDPNMVCEVCDGDIESVDDADFSWMRYRKHLCREHFAAMKNQRKTA